MGWARLRSDALNARNCGIQADARLFANSKIRRRVRRALGSADLEKALTSPR